VQELGRLARRWVTLNEPWCSALLGYYEGRFALGHTSYEEAYSAVHHLLLAHGLGLAAIRAASAEAEVGITCNLADIAPASATDADRSRRRHGGDRLFLDPVFKGAYPDDAPEFLRDDRLVRENDLVAISAPLDFFGLNYYIREVIAGDSLEPNRLRDALRPRLRRVLHPAADPEIERALVPRRHQGKRHPRRKRTRLRRPARLSSSRLWAGAVRLPQTLSPVRCTGSLYELLERQGALLAWPEIGDGVSDPWPA
jgi:beta-glucosidase/6-phospho-beta-glucosidase/beta-galactosidase